MNTTRSAPRAPRRSPRRSRRTGRYAGAASLAAALEKNRTLQTLDLYNNSVGDAGAASCEAIKAACARNKAAAECS